MHNPNMLPTTLYQNQNSFYEKKVGSIDPTFLKWLVIWGHPWWIMVESTLATLKEPFYPPEIAGLMSRAYEGHWFFSRFFSAGYYINPYESWGNGRLGGRVGWKSPWNIESISLPSNLHPKTPKTKRRSKLAKPGSWCSVETVGTIPSDAKIEVSEAKVHQCLLAHQGLCFAVYLEDHTL